MDFDSLFDYCIKLNESTSEKCLVCHIPIENNDAHLKLKCSHLFHPNCISYKSGSVKCLYCEKTSVPDLINNTSKQVHQINSESNLNKQSNICCKVQLKSGPNKGQYCNRVNCKYHKIQSQPIVILNQSASKIPKPKKIIKINKCTVILKTGVKCGQECGRELPCKYHKIIPSDVSFNSEKMVLNTKTNNSFTNLNVNKYIDNEEDDLIEV